MKLYDFFKQLTMEEYERHPTYTLSNILNDGLPSDCQDRSYALGDFAKELGYNPKFLWLVWWKPLDAHVVVLINGRVWDATWLMDGKADYWDYPLPQYLDDANADFTIITPYWVRKIIR